MRSDERELTTREVAELLGVSGNTVRRLASIGELPCVRTIGRHRRYRAADVAAAWERRQTRSADAAAACAVHGRQVPPGVLLETHDEIAARPPAHRGRGSTTTPFSPPVAARPRADGSSP